MSYVSANFDEEVFDDPHKFDITRDPNPHLSFGGTGAHYCLGANLARMEIELIFNAIADFLPDITEAGDTRRLRSGWLNGIKEYQVDYKTGGCRSSTSFDAHHRRGGAGEFPHPSSAPPLVWGRIRGVTVP